MPTLFSRCLIVSLVLSVSGSQAYAQPPGPSDHHATKETIALFRYLRLISGKHILFGHQDALAYGVHWKEWHKQRSDIKDVSGVHPAVFGWELGRLGKAPQNIDGVPFSHMQGWIREAYKMGCINTISWHMDNYANGGTAWNTEFGNVVATILPGGTNHEAFKKDLDEFAAFLKSLRTGFIFKKNIPLIFRPFHEHTGHWFWWGQPHCSPDEYKALWRFTVHYLREVKGIHHLLYAYSPDLFRDKTHYLECYPGDEWVDIIGTDNYHDLGPNGKPEDLIWRLRDVVRIATEKGKIAALTETGYEGIRNPQWWTQQLLAPIMADTVASRISWLMVWRNANEKHHYAPYPGHPSVPDFLEFINDERMLHSGRMQDIYRTSTH